MRTATNYQKRKRFTRNDVAKGAQILDVLNTLGVSKYSIARVREDIGPDLFDYAITNNMNAVLLKPFSEPMFQEWKQVVSISDDSDLQQQIGIRVSGFGDVLEPFTGSFKDTDLPEEEQTEYQIDGFGEIFGIDFETATNDKLKALLFKTEDLGKKYAKGFQKWMFQDLLQADPTYTPDSKVLFHTDHNNDLHPGSPVSANPLNFDNLKSAWMKLSGQTQQDGTPVDLNTFYIVCGSENVLEAEAIQEAQGNPDSANSDPNTLKKRIKGIIYHKYLGSDWYIVAPKEISNNMHVGFLQSVGQVPRLVKQAETSDEHFRTLKTNWRVDYWYGGTWLDFRGVVRGSQNV